MLEINKKEDIIIPFDNIGDNNWELKTKLIIDSLAENWNKKAKEPISTDDIKKLEERLGTSLPENLKTFHNTFGLSDIGEQLQDFEDIGWIKDIWADNPYGSDFTEDDKVFLPYLISFSDYLGNGNMFCFHSQTKEIYYYDHDDTPYITKMFNTVDEYLKGCLIFAQSDLFGEAEQEDVEEWAEEIVSEIVGKETVEKWRY
ncbi:MULTISPECIES: SMI1/KNR4 family protein [Chryseobacterium]|uniref:SMI1/KNR4 family protein n=1 Tax=Candidatus Chryseobacterium massiliense TaxID=204089 RepID=A0A3D9AGF0_9FLAO|nr:MULTISPECIES: SMI1/KNR4 family protein [Chryseobacterium]REC40459.1 SMI1/KNR4 family protein [Candidatus Chryseobacterium massiliae]